MMFRETLAQVPKINIHFPVYLFACLGFYAFPLICHRYKLLINKTAALVLPAAALVYLFFQPRPNFFYILLDSPITTLGLFHTLLGYFPKPLDAVLMFLFYLLGVSFFISLLIQEESAREIKIITVVFFLMNIGAHIVWDKYLMPVLPFIYLLAL